MCGPAAAAVVTVIGGAVSAYGQNQAGKYAAAVAAQNAKNSDTLAGQTEQIGLQDELRARMQIRQILGKQRATAAANGLDVNTGSALDIMAETAGIGETDATMVRANAYRDAWGYRTQGANYRAEGAMARSAGRYGAASTLLTSGAQAYGIWRNG